MGSDLKAGTMAKVTKTALLDGKVAFNPGDKDLLRPWPSRFGQWLRGVTSTA